MSRTALLTWVAVASLFLGGIGGMIVFAAQNARAAARRNGCLCRLRQISLALLNYESAHGTFPPAYTVDASGNRLHSWRTLILPYLDEHSLYDSIDFSKPWDHPVNAHARAACPELYHCPNSTHRPEFTTYLAMVGPDCAFTGSQPTKLNVAQGGGWRPFALLEAPPAHAVEWMSPQDADEAMFLGLQKESITHHPEGVLVAFVDCHVAVVSLDTSLAARRALITAPQATTTKDRSPSGTDETQ